MGLQTLILIAAFAVMPAAAAWADETVPPPGVEAETLAAPVATEDFDDLATGSVDVAPAGEAEEVWMTPSQDAVGGGCHRSKKQQTVYYTN